MIDKKKIYDDIFNNPKYMGLSYYQIETIYKNALIGIYDDSLIKKEELKRRYAYSPKKAVEYAIKYALNYNTSYPSYKGSGGDCANFISQALHAGGKPMVGNNAASMKSWFCWSRNKWDVKSISSTWRGANAFSVYWKVNANSYRDFDKSYFKSLEAFKSIYNYASRGDALSFLDYNGSAYHTLIVVDYSNGDLICASHAYDSNNRSLFADSPEGGVRIYKMS